ncbi:MAG: CD225/dispanin family protein [Marinilabiliaceae bacterium]
MPPTYLVWSIVMTILCCLPFGIVAIVKSSKVESYYFLGLYAESLKSSNDAKIWCIVSACAGVVLYVTLFFVEILAFIGDELHD